MPSTDATMGGAQGPPPARRDAADAAALRRSLACAADTVVGSAAFAMWTANAASAARIALRRAFGEDSRAAAVANEVSIASMAALVLQMSFALLILGLLAWCERDEGRRKRHEVGESGGGDAMRPAVQGRRQPERASLNGLCGPVALRIFCVLWVFIAMSLVIQMCGPAKGSCAEKVSSMLRDVGCFLHSVMFCSIIFPRYLTQLIKRWTVKLH